MSRTRSHGAGEQSSTAHPAAPNQALEPTPTAFARTSLRLLAAAHRRRSASMERRKAT